MKVELSITEWVVVQAMRGNGRIVRELLNNLDDDEKEELVNVLLYMPVRSKILLKKLGYDEMGVYQAEENYFDKVNKFSEDIKKLLSGE